MLRLLLKTIVRLLSILLVAALLVLFLPRLITSLHAWTRIYDRQSVPVHQVAIVFGAGLWRDGSPTPVLRDRVTTAAELYFNGKVDKLLMSGDNSTENYDEPGAMLTYAMSLGVPEDAIVVDYAGRRTYDTCYRARDIFGIDEAILVTQGYHLPRAIYTCNGLGVTAVGVASDLRTYRRGSIFFWSLREIPATLVALVDIHLTQPVPVLGNPEPIFPYEAQQEKKENKDGT